MPVQVRPRVQMQPIIDSHCHIDLTIQKGISEQDIFAGIQEQNVAAVIQIAAAPSNAPFAAELAQRDLPFAVFYTIGFHPAEVAIENPDDAERLIREHASRERFAAIGEIGLDYFYGSETQEHQKQVFRRFLQLAQELSLPVVIHTRDAHEDTISLLGEFPQVKPLIHCYTGNEVQIEDYLALGAWISFSGIVTFKNAEALRKAALRCPVDKLLVETDAPYLTPVPMRGKTNQPGYVRHTLRFLSELKNIPEDELAAITRKNTEEFFSLVINRQ